MSQATRSEAEQQKLLDALHELFEHKITFNNYLGFCIDSLAADHTRIRFDMKPELVGHYHYGRLHGGVISAVLDATAGLAVMWGLCLKHAADDTEQMLLRFNRLGTIDMRIDYLLPGNGETFVARANILRLGKRIACTRMELFNDSEQLLASGAGNYTVS